MRKVFFSFSNQDQGVFQQLASAMQDTEVLGLMDPENISSGESLSVLLRTYIRAADVVVVLLSENVRTNKWVIFEAGVAQGFGKKIIPVLLPGAPLEGSMPEILKDVQVLDARNLPVNEVARQIKALS
jgi:hypothetical protein